MLEFNTDLSSEQVKIDGRELVLWELTGTQRDQYETSLVNIDENGKITLSKDNVKAKLVHIALKTPDGKSAFESVDDVGALPARVLNSLFDEARSLSGIDDGERAKKD